VPTLDDLAAQLATSDEWEEERATAHALASEIATNPPSSLTEAAGEWKEPYLHLRLVHRDGTVIRVTHGDGYTAVVGGGVNYQGYLDTAYTIDVMVGAVRGRITYVRHTRFGQEVADYFEVVGREGQRLGYGKGIAGVLPFLFKAIPLLPEAVARKRISFDGTPAITDMP
jgi:hypothetical protein